MRNRSFLSLIVLLAAAFALAGCNRDPETVKRRYLQNGDKYLAQGKVKEAIIMYRNAVKKDPRFGDAYLKLGDAETKRGEIRQAVAAYTRAVDLLRGDQREEAAGKLADIYLIVFTFKSKENAPLLREVRILADSLLKDNPKSFQGLRLRGFLAVAEKKDGYLSAAIDSFRQADAVKPNQPELLFALVQVLNQNGDWTEAESIAKGITVSSPQFPPAYQFLFSNYIRRNQMAEAEAVFDLRIKNNPKVHQFVIDKAAFYRATQRVDQSEKVLADLLARETADNKYRAAIGDFYSRIKEYDKALKIYSEGASRYPVDRSAYRVRMVSSYVAKGQSKEALKLLEQTLADDPKNDEALSMRASLKLTYGDNKDVQAAIADLQGLIGRAPDNAVTRYNLARAYHTRGELDAARVQYQEATKVNPRMTVAYIGLGQVHLAKRDPGKAIIAAEEILKYDPKNLAARVIKLNALINSGNIRQARSEGTLYLTDSPDSPDLKFQLAIVDFMDNRLKEAEASFRALRTRFPSDLRLTYALAEVLLRSNRQSEALKFLQDELARSPQNKDLRLAVGNTALRVDQPELAEKEFRALLAADSGNFDYYLRLGETLRRRGQNQAALDVLRKGQQLAPTNPVANLQLAMTLDTLGMRKDSLPLYEVVIRGDAENLVALNNLAFMYADEGRNLDVALTYAQRAKQKAPNNPDIADTLAWVYIKKNLSDNAITILRDLTTTQPKNPTYHYHLGVALLQKGNKPAARQSLQNALGLNPAKDDEARIRELIAKAG